MNVPAGIGINVIFVPSSNVSTIGLGATGVFFGAKVCADSFENDTDCCEMFSEQTGTEMSRILGEETSTSPQFPAQTDAEMPQIEKQTKMIL